MQFHETGYGRKFFEQQLPKLTTEIGRLADAINKSNELKEKELNLKENTSEDTGGNENE